jgi:hypothetical protein
MLKAGTETGNVHVGGMKDYRATTIAVVSNLTCDDWETMPLIAAEILAQQGEIWRCSLCEKTYEGSEPTFHRVGTSALCLSLR